MEILTNEMCCVTGHRDINAREYTTVYRQLEVIINEAIADGYVHFFSGFADGADCIFATVINDMIQSGANIRLYAAIPHGGRYLQMAKNAYYYDILKACSIIEILSHEYTPYCFMKRNKYMVDCSSLVIAVTDGREKGGTYNTILYAKSKNKQIKYVKY